MEKEKEKEREPFPAGSTVLFSVDARGNIVDHAVCRDDVECGGYLFRQAELALKGAYVPGETVYCLSGPGHTDKEPDKNSGRPNLKCRRAWQPGWTR